MLALADSKELEPSIDTIRALTQTDKEFYGILHDPITIRTFIYTLAQKFDVPSEYIAKKLSIDSSRIYQALSLQLLSALWQQDFDTAATLIKDGADINFQTADSYPTEYNLEMTLGMLAIPSFHMLEELLHKEIRAQQVMKIMTDISSFPKEFEILQSCVQEAGFASEENLAGIFHKAQIDHARQLELAQALAQRTKKLFADDNLVDKLLAQIKNDDLQEALALIKAKKIKPCNGTMITIAGDTSSIVGAGFSVVMYAIITNQLAILEWLIEHNADLNATMGTGHTALLIAIKLDRSDMVELLIRKGTDINQKNRLYEKLGNTINVGDIMVSVCKVKFYYDKTLHDLLESKDIESIVYHALKRPGSTPLIALACKDGHTDLMKLLLSHSADPLIKDDKGWTAFDYMKSKARKNDPARKEKIQLLEEAIFKKQSFICCSKKIDCL
jgi:hypothetical protein